MVEFELDELMLEEVGEFLIHLPVNWFTLKGLLMSCGFVPTGFREGANGPPKNCNGNGKHGGGGGLLIGQSYSSGCGVNGLCKLFMHGLARLTEGLV